MPPPGTLAPVPGTIIPITHADARIADYADLKDADLRRRERSGAHGVFIAEGEPVVRRLASSRFPVRSVLVARPHLPRVADLVGSLPDGTPVFVADLDVLERVVGFSFHRGVLAAGGRVPSPGVADLARDSRVVVVCENLANPDNVGAVFRDAACLAGRGAGVVLSPGCCDPLYRKAIRVSMGHALGVPYARAADWPADLAALHRAGFRLAALTPAPDAVSLADLPERGERWALMVGTEGPGLTPAAQAAADVRVRIPMAPGADSLNVGVALAVALSRLVSPL